MLGKFIRKVTRPIFLNRPKVAVCVPLGLTGVERRAFEDAAGSAGARSVTLIEAPIAAAIGAGIKIGAPRGSFIIDIGGGTTEVATSLRSAASSPPPRCARRPPRWMTPSTPYIKRRYNVGISPKTAEALKLRIGSVHPQADAGAMEVRGKNLASGLPVTLNVTSGDVRDAVGDVMEQILDCIRAVLEKTPPSSAPTSTTAAFC